MFLVNQKPRIKKKKKNVTESWTSRGCGRKERSIEGIDCGNFTNLPELSHEAAHGNYLVLRPENSSGMDLAISVSNLTYHHNTLSAPSLFNVNLALPPGSRTLLIGANGGPPFPSPSDPELTFCSGEIHFAPASRRSQAHKRAWCRCESQRARCLS